MNELKKLTEAEMTRIITNIRQHTEEYILNNKLQSLVLGISGGIDSAIVCALLKPVCDKLNIPMIGRYIHISTNSPDELNRAINIADAFDVNFDKLDLTELDNYYHNTFDIPQQIVETATKFKIRRGNVKARLRMITLYNLAQISKGVVLSTDNLTEYYLGFWTLHGDVGDYGPIQQLWKSEIYQLSEYMVSTELKEYPLKRVALGECISCNATDGLGITKTDLDQIMPDWKNRHENTRSGYKEVDEILSEHINKGKQFPNGHYANIVVDRYYASMFKRNNPYNIDRYIIMKNLEK